MAQFTQALRSSRRLFRNGWSRFAFIRGTGDRDFLYVNGEEYPLDRRLQGLLEHIAGQRLAAYGKLVQWLEDPDGARLLTRLYNEGHFYFKDE